MLLHHPCSDLSSYGGLSAAASPCAGLSWFSFSLWLEVPRKSKRRYLASLRSSYFIVYLDRKEPKGFNSLFALADSENRGRKLPKLLFG